jgi:hypothetical protein
LVSSALPLHSAVISSTLTTKEICNVT